MFTFELILPFWKHDGENSIWKRDTSQTIRIFSHVKTLIFIAFEKLFQEFAKILIMPFTANFS